MSKDIDEACSVSVSPLFKDRLFHPPSYIDDRVKVTLICDLEFFTFYRNNNKLMVHFLQLDETAC